MDSIQDPDSPPQDSEDSISYQFEMREQPWRAWRETIPRDMSVRQRLVWLIRRDISDPRPVEDGEQVVKQLATSKRLWSDWVDTIPRSYSVDDRLEDLIRMDVASADRDGEVNQAAVDVMVTRLRVRARGAMSAIRDDNDPEYAVEQIEEIMELVSAMES